MKGFVAWLRTLPARLRSRSGPAVLALPRPNPERVKIEELDEAALGPIENAGIHLAPSQCYRIAWDLVVTGRAKHYVLGIVSQPARGREVEHAWVRLDDGHHVDPLFQRHNMLGGTIHVAHHQFTRQGLLDLLRAKYGDEAFESFVKNKGPGLDPPRINARGEIFFGDD